MQQPVATYASAENANPHPPIQERDCAAMSSVLAELDRIPDRPDALDPLQWDELGLPK
jgi:hypothetical protein